jgi:putative heme-binding domain-containing protein
MVKANDRNVASSDDWSQLAEGDAGRPLKPGLNTISVSAKNDGGPAGILAYLKIELEDGKTIIIRSDSSWKASTKPEGNWRSVSFDDSHWSDVTVLGEVGQQSLPWSEAINRDVLASAFGNTGKGEFVPEIAQNAQVPKGFKVEKIFNVPRAMGSWVSLTTDDKGRLIACDQGGAGLYLITPGDSTRPTRVEALPIKLSGAQGLLWAFDSLYAVVNGGDQSGLHRLRDTNDDGLVDSDEHCMFVPGGGEHGPHAVVLSPDGKSLFVAAGNHTKLPDAIVGSRIPQNWNEDHLLPRRWDANGHAAGILAPGGWICNVDQTGKQWTVFSMGYRNQYDIAFNTEGELFTYDADMEWDFGSPWYRPTRVLHATSGSEFGWRSGTGKWPTYYEDSLPPSVDIGPGSPTGVVFGTGAKFPAKYQKSLFILDWTYSTIYSVELVPEGSTYKGIKTDFVTASPLPVTDAVVGLDGALYFAVGGRGAQSSLYRVSYVGDESTEAVASSDPQFAELRALRRRLENFHGVRADLRLISPYLGNRDRFIRYAARVALESQPIDEWLELAFAQQSNLATMNCMLALAHQGTRGELPRLVDKLGQLELESMNEEEQLIWLRVLQVAFARHGEPSESQRETLLKRLDAIYPVGRYPLNAELVQLLVYLKSPTVVEKTLALMKKLGPEPIPEWGYLVSRNAGYGGTIGKMLADMPPARAIHFAFVLRNVNSGWTLDQRKEYFQFFIDAAKHPGGNSYAKFLMQFRDDALATCTPAEQLVLETLAGRSLLSEPIETTPPKGPGRKWTVSQALTELEKKANDVQPDYQAGRNLYHATSCAKCHRLNGEGGAIGPDLSTAAKKFSMTDMLDAIIEPSKVISDQYGSQQVLTSDGKVLIGRAIEIGDQWYVYTIDADAKPTILKKDEVEQVTPSKVSQMPLGLIDSLNANELRELMTYLTAAGDRRAPAYRRRR